MNVAETMRKVLPELNKGLDGIRLHLKPECEEEWNEGYAIVQGLYYMRPGEMGEAGGDYFDDYRFRDDYEEKVRSMFPGINVKFYWQSQEIEFCK